MFWLLVTAVTAGPSPEHRSGSLPSPETRRPAAVALLVKTVFDVPPSTPGAVSAAPGVLAMDISLLARSAQPPRCSRTRLAGAGCAGRPGGVRLREHCRHFSDGDRHRSDRSHCGLAHRDLGWAYLLAGRAADAEGELERARQIRGTPNAHLYLGLLHTARGDVERAQEMVSAGRAIEATDPSLAALRAILTGEPGDSAVMARLREVLDNVGSWAQR